MFRELRVSLELARPILRIEIKRTGELREFIKALHEFENIYNHLYTFDLIIHQAKEATESTISGMLLPGRTLREIPNVEEMVLPTDRLRISQIQVGSAGLIALVGSLNPLETIRKYLSDRHERRKDKDWREPAEAEKMALENLLLKQEIIMSEIELLKEIGYPEDYIRSIIARHFFQPIEALDRLQDDGLIGRAQIINGEQGEKDALKIKF